MPETFEIELTYEDGVFGTVDRFAKCFVESGARAWPNGYELCPDAVRKWIATGRGRHVA